MRQQPAREGEELLLLTPPGTSGDAGVSVSVVVLGVSAVLGGVVCEGGCDEGRGVGITVA